VISLVLSVGRVVTSLFIALFSYVLYVFIYAFRSLCSSLVSLGI